MAELRTAVTPEADYKSDVLDFVYRLLGHRSTLAHVTPFNIVVLHKISLPCHWVPARVLKPAVAY